MRTDLYVNSLLDTIEMYKRLLEEKDKFIDKQQQLLKELFLKDESENTGTGIQIKGNYK